MAVQKPIEAIAASKFYTSKTYIFEAVGAETTFTIPAESYANGDLVNMYYIPKSDELSVFKLKETENYDLAAETGVVTIFALEAGDKVKCIITKLDKLAEALNGTTISQTIATGESADDANAVPSVAAIKKYIKENGGTGGGGGTTDIAPLENRVTALEETVGSVNTMIDEINAML